MPVESKLEQWISSSCYTRARWEKVSIMYVIWTRIDICWCSERVYALFSWCWAKKRPAKINFSRPSAAFADDQRFERDDCDDDDVVCETSFRHFPDEFYKTISSAPMSTFAIFCAKKKLDINERVLFSKWLFSISCSLQHFLAWLRLDKIGGKSIAQYL